MLRSLALAIVGALFGSALTYAWLTAAGPAVFESENPVVAPRSTSIMRGDAALPSMEVEGLEGDEPSLALYERAAKDPVAALAELETIDDPATRIAAAIAALDVVGAGEAAFAAVLARLPPADQPTFVVEALGRRAQWEPEQAAAQALTLDVPSQRFSALRRIAQVWAHEAPAAAMAYGVALSSPALRRVFCYEVLDVWSRLEPQAALAAAANTSVDLGVLQSAYDPLAASVAFAPEQALALLATYPPALRQRVQTTALRAIAERDPAAARERAETMMPGQERDSLLSYVAENWASRDPDAAIAWLESLSPPSQTVRMSAVRGLARVDFDRAVDLWLDDDALSLPTGLPLEDNLDRLPALMDRLMTRPGRRSSIAGIASMSSISMILSTWTRNEPEAALGWLVGREDVDERLVDVVARGFAARDAEAAAAAVHRVPEQLRPAWIDGVATDYARTDVEKALGWLAQFRGQPAYDEWVQSVVQSVADRDPVVAAQLLVTGEASLQRNTPYVARAWANRDVVRAAEWASGLPNQEQRDAAARMVAAQWVTADAEAARRWALSLSGSTRDGAVTAIIEFDVGRTRTIDRTLLDALSSASTRQRLVRAAVPNLVRDPVQARNLIDTYIADPTERRAAHEELVRLLP